MHTQLVSWARGLFLAGVALSLVMVVPVAWIPFQLTKIALFSVLLAACAVLYCLGGGMRDFLRAHGLSLALLVALLPLGYLLSWAFSVDRTMGLMGYAVETDTVLFVVLATAAYLLSFALFRTLRTARMLLEVLFWSLAAAAIFQLVSILFGQSILPFETLSDRSSNLVGKWNDLGFLAALLGLLLFARVELGNQSHLWKVGAGAGGLSVLFLLGLVNFAPAWAFFLAGCIVLALVVLVSRRAGAGAGLPIYSSLGGAAAVLFLLFGSTFNTSLTSVFPVSSLEVRPSLSSTLELSAAERTSFARAALGSGPGTFGERWLLHKPAEVNQTPFWNLDFNVGYSTVSSALVSVGLIGVALWVLPLLLLLGAIVRALRLGLLSPQERVVALSLGGASLFMYAALLFYVPSSNLVLFAFVVSGATFGFLWRQGRTAEAEEGIPRYAVLGASAVMIAVVLVAGAFVSRRFVAETYSGAALYALAQGDADTALARAERAIAIEPAQDMLRVRSVAGARKLALLAQSTDVPAEQARDLFSKEAERTVSAAQAFVAAAPQDYRPYLILAQIYQLFSSLKIEGAYGAAQNAFAAAAVRNPMSPAIPLELARLHALEGDAQATQEALTKSLTLKADYTDAILFLVDINVAQNDLASAIQNAEAAARSAPGVASIWFALGVLYEAANDNERAALALEQALSLEPQYANAKYYLGVVYSRLNKNAEAQALFEGLAAQNPDNAVVAKILENLRAGRGALEGVTGQGEGAPVEE